MLIINAACTIVPVVALVAQQPTGSINTVMNTTMNTTMITNATVFSRVFAVLIVVIAMSHPAYYTEALAQSTMPEMSLEELEAFVKEQEKALEAAKAERDRNLAAQKAVQEDLKRQQDRQAEIEEELQELCLERKKLDPASSEECL